MKWWFSIIIGLCVSPVWSEQFSITDFSGGLNSRYSSVIIADNEVQDSLNVYFDKTAPIETREGFTACGSSESYSYSRAWSYSDAGNSNYLIVRAPSRIIAANTGCDFDVLIATVNANQVVNAVNALGFIWFVDRERGVYNWNGSSTTFVSGSPLGQYIAEFRERVCVSGIAHPNGNDLYCSAYLDGTDWDTSSTLATGAVLLRVGLNDAYDNITSLFSGYNDAMQIWKNRSMYALYGFDKDSFQIRVLSREAGCTDQQSVKPFMGGLVFASERGIEFFNGVQVQTPPISDKIADKMGAATVSTFNEASWTQTSQADFESGVSSPAIGGVSFSISPGAVSVSSFGRTDTSDSDWDSPEITISGGGQISGGSIVVSTSPSTDVGDNDFEIGSVWTGGTQWIRQNNSSVATDSCGDVSAYSGNDFMWYNGPIASYSVDFELIDAGDSSVISEYTYAWTDATCSASQFTIPSSAGSMRKEVKLRMCKDADCHTSLPFWYTGEPITFFAWSDSRLSDTSRVVFVDLFEGGKILSTSFQVQTVLSPGPTFFYLLPTAEWTVDEKTPSFALDKSANGSSWTTNILTSTGSSIFVDRPFIRTTVSLSATTGSDIGTSLDSQTLVLRTTGTYLSSVHNDDDITSWSTLTVDKVDNGGTQTFYMRSSTNTFTVQSATPAWTAQTANTVISIATGTYFQLRDDFSVTHATQNPTLNEFTISWNEGTPRNSMASVTDDKRYYLSLTTYTAATANNATLVLSPGPIWSIWDMAVGAFVDHKGQIYHANNQDNGKVYTDFLGSSDDGTAINAFVKTKDYPLGDITKDKLFDSLYLIADAQSGADLDTAYYVNKSTTGYSLYSLPLTSNDGILSERLNFPLDSGHPNRGKTISFKFSNDDLDEAIKFYGGILNYRIRRTE